MIMKLKLLRSLSGNPQLHFVVILAVLISFKARILCSEITCCCCRHFEVFVHLYMLLSNFYTKVMFYLVCSHV